MNALKLVKKYARLKNLNNISMLDWIILIFNLILLIISIKSVFVGKKIADASFAWVDGYTPDIYDYIRKFFEDVFEYPALLCGILGFFGSLMIIHMILKK